MVSSEYMDTKKAFMEKHLFETQDILCDVALKAYKSHYLHACLIKPFFPLGGIFPRIFTAKTEKKTGDQLARAEVK